MIRHRRGVRGLACAVIVSLAAASPLRAAATADQVDDAIERGRKFLLAHRNADGTWEEAAAPAPGGTDEARLSVRARQWGGLTALASYALLAAGEDWRDSDMARAIDFLLHANLQSTYGLGLSSQLLMFLPPEKTRLLAAHNFALLRDGLIAPPIGQAISRWPAQAGFYGYWTGLPQGTVQTRMTTGAASGRPQPAGWYDRSNSQYAVLGMWALEQSGMRVPPLYWEIVEAVWKKSQAQDGGWGYRDESEVTPSMTAAGIATLFITQDHTLKGNWINCRGGISNPAIDRGLTWMDDHIDQAIQDSYYTLYGIERIGAASGRKYFGSKDWYQLGADFLVSHQNKDGSWQGSQGSIPDTCFALLFLSRGRAPVLMNKLEYDDTGVRDALPDVWNERPRDIANLAAWVGRQDETFFNWQIVNLKVSDEQWHDAPILYISGARAPEFDEEELAKLRRFVQEGGMILGNADCAQEEFTRGFQRLGAKLFPKYEFQQAGPEDLIWHEQFTRFTLRPRVMQQTNGVRKLLVLLPEGDPGRAWQMRAEQVRRVVFDLGANLFLYAVDRKNLSDKGRTYIVRPDPAVKATETLRVARLRIGDNPDPEPAGWTRLSAVMHNRFQIDVQTGSATPDDLAGYRIADLTGTTKIVLSPRQRTQLRDFVNGGGTLIVDAAGGSIAFADSMQAELNVLFAADRFDVIPSDAPVYTQPGAKIGKIGWRSFAMDHIADHRHAQIRGVTVGNRIGVFFSREDLSAGLVGEPVDGIIGYEPASATDLMAAILLYARNRH